ncbi:NAD(P)-dependent alcohol dehydrogenase [Salmonella enterica]|nr:NAD(P)-dependent alcohol dehydrogenase [Salmonella enterica]EEK4519434.1 alcohol dehydrogenase catalytic domain-containing protein [Salmonella enterica]EIP9519442.1 NAD(P)-dependent alcohol dehydrogenase [Salmonella enterica]
MKSLMLSPDRNVTIEDCFFEETLGDDDVQIKIHSVGICGSDVHYYQYGRIGSFVVESPMVLGHEASGIVIATGKNVTHLKPGDRVCMEPGIPDFHSTQSLSGYYNLDPSVRFWATPPVHGCLRETVIHPGALTFKLPENVSFAEGAMVEPLAIGMHAATKAEIKPGDIALVTGAGTIGMVTALSALAGGCSEVIICDQFDKKLSVIGEYDNIHIVNTQKKSLKDEVNRLTDGHGVDIVFECCGALELIEEMTDYIVPGGKIVLIGMPVTPVSLNVVSAQSKEITIKTIFRYANMYPRTLRLLSSGKLKVSPLISAKYKFMDSIQAFKRAARGELGDVKILIEME